MGIEPTIFMSNFVSSFELEVIRRGLYSSSSSSDSIAYRGGTVSESGSTS